MTDDEATCLVIGLAIAHERVDKEAWAALWYGGPDPVDERQLLIVACKLIAGLAAEQGDAVEVLARWALAHASE